MFNKTSESVLEDNIDDALSSHGWIKRTPENYDKDHALDTQTFLDFLQSSQPQEWGKIFNTHGQNHDHAKVLDSLQKVINKDGTLATLRNGFQYDTQVKFSLMYSKPVSTKNETTLNNYNQNILSFIRQVRTTDNKIPDITLFINGIPFATIELKNGLTQKVTDAIKQYKGRNANEKLFRRCLVHFAVDPDEVYMTTQLNGEQTRFLPFNKGDAHGRGNPHNPNGYKTSYLWENILQRDSIIDILHRFIHKSDNNTNTIFPRYHQLDVVRKLVEDAKEKGAGQNYLIQHSAGSGKSNTIAWLAHHLQNLYNQQDENIFSSVIIMTDRCVLDRQLQDTVDQFDHVSGVVEKVRDGAKQLEAFLLAGKKIIITTLQKFPFMEIVKTKKLDLFKDKNFAIIIDEAHSSQYGEASRTVRKLLGSPSQENEQLLSQEAKEEAEESLRNDSEIQIANEVAKQGKLRNLSFFAFTATPKPKTLETFGQKGKDNLPHPFHLYSMKQAIQEGFILDVLKYYQTYKSYFKIAKAITDDPLYSKKQANKSLAKYLDLHPSSRSQKTEIMLEHFRTVTKKKINGQGKAMLVTASRRHAILYYQEFQNYIKTHHYQNEIKVLIAFSGTIQYNEQEWTESRMNGFSESELKIKFHDEYHILIVAEKYQTGFDEPLLHTMFVDKKLAGVQAVQTLSRLNRIAPQKIDTFVLDFANDADAIQEAFDPYYRETKIDEETDVNLVHDIKDKLDQYQIIWQTEVDNFASIFFNTKASKQDAAKLHSFITPATDRYRDKLEDEQAEFKSTLLKFIRTYELISNLVALQDVPLHKFHAYVKFLVHKLANNTPGASMDLSQEITLEYYRLQEVSNGAISLEGDQILENDKHAGKAGTSDDIEVSLSNLLKTLNEQLGFDFEDQDRVFVEHCCNKLSQDPTLQEKARNNTLENFAMPLRDRVEEEFHDSYENNKAFVDTFFKEAVYAKELNKIIAQYIYKKINSVA